MGEVYRPPSGSSLLCFFKEFNEVIESMHQQPCEIILMGDFNINLLRNNNSVPADFLSAMLTHCLLPTIIIQLELLINQLLY